MELCDNNYKIYAIYLLAKIEKYFRPLKIPLKSCLRMFYLTSPDAPYSNSPCQALPALQRLSLANAAFSHSFGCCDPSLKSELP